MKPISPVTQGNPTRNALAGLLTATIALLAACNGAGNEAATTGVAVPTGSELAAMLAADPATVPGPAVQLLQRAVLDLPALASSQDAVAGAERAAMAAARAGMLATTTPQGAGGSSVARRLAAGASAFGPGGPVTTLFLLDMARSAGESAPDGNFPQPYTVPREQGGAQVSVTLDSHLGIDGARSVQMESHQSVSEGGSTLSSDFKVKVGGKSCPDAAGQVRIQIDISDSFSGSSGGLSASGSRQLSGTATAQVNDAADMVKLDFDFSMTTSGRRAGGATYGAGATASFGYTGTGLGSAPGGKLADGPATLNWTGRTPGTTQADLSREALAGLPEFSLIADGTMKQLQDRWRSGACVHIVAAKPGPVPTGTSVAINVAVRHLVDSVELHLPVTVALNGARSATPARIDASPGLVTYTAPDQEGASGTLTLKTVSRRGIDTHTLALRAYQRTYRITGGGDGLEVDDRAGPLDQVFTFSGTFPGGEAEFTCTPADKRSGSVTGALSGSGMTGHVSGSYSIVGPDEGPLTMTQTTYGCVDNVPGSCRTTTAVFTLKP